ncbi:MAG: hypothetical protein KGO81_06500 [Bacteroidota bacterium]|nr:hypothetical protein [Bacteroidota bacterium]
MFKFLSKVENLLIFIPIMVLYVFYAVSPDGYMGMVLDGEYVNISIFELGITLLLLLLIPYIFHYTLRLQIKKATVVAKIHVYVSLAIIVGNGIIYYNTPLISYRWQNEILPPPIYDTWRYSLHLSYALWQLFFIVQIAFVVYAILKMRKTPPKESAGNNSSLAS